MNPTSGGPCQGIRNTNPELVIHGITREVVSLDDPNSSFLGSDDFIIHALGPAVGPWQYSSRLMPWLITNIPRFDVIIINGLWSYSDYAGWRAVCTIKQTAKKSGSTLPMPKVYVMPHGMLDPYFQRAPDRKLKALRNWVYWKIVERKIVNDADGLFFTCEKEMQLARQTFTPYHPKKEVNVGYGIIAPPTYDITMKEAFEKVCPGVVNKPFLLFLSRINKKKGVEMLITAYAELVKKANASGIDIIKLVIAGPDANYGYGTKIQQMAASNPEIKDHVFFPGMLTGKTKWGALYLCDAFILPSHQENFGIAIVEAMACKKAVLVSDQVNIWQEIKNGNGGLVENDTMDGTIQLLEKWQSLNSPEKQNIGENAFKIYRTHFDIKLVAKKFVRAVFERN